MIFFVAGCSGNDKNATVEHVDIPVVSKGKMLFKNNCASCHKIDRDFAGPALQGSLERWGGDKKMMYDFIRNSAQIENAYTITLKKRWSPAIMTSFNLSDAELDSIMNYCSKYEPGPVAVVVN